MLNSDYLINLDSQKNRKIYGRIMALNISEQPMKTLEGVITTGSINVDGASGNHTLQCFHWLF